MTTTISTPPKDPESAALDFIVRIAEALPGGAPALRAALQNLASVLQLEGALTGLATMADARLAAATIADAAGTIRAAPTLKASPRRSTPPQPCWT
jgi:hypothetical protein